MTNSPTTDQAGVPSDKQRIDELGARLCGLEELFMHLQRTVQDLDQVLVEHGKQLAGLEQQIRGATDLINALSNMQPASPPNLLDEKPPHY